MPNYKTHNNSGIYTGLLTGTFFIIERLRCGENIGIKQGIKFLGIGALGGFIGATLLDVLEPAYHPNHRDLAHSFGTGGLICHLLHKSLTENEQNQRKTEHLFFIALGAGYISHLVLDARTKKGLPVLLKF